VELSFSEPQRDVRLNAAYCHPHPYKCGGAVLDSLRARVPLLTLINRLLNHVKDISVAYLMGYPNDVQYSSTPVLDTRENALLKIGATSPRIGGLASFLQSVNQISGQVAYTH
ncbi:hypothetical protein J6590_107599, partial [Homalodisca vitripennis]